MSNHTIIHACFQDNLIGQAHVLNGSLPGKAKGRLLTVKTGFTRPAALKSCRFFEWIRA
jgi:hypothetical protein